VSDDPALIGHDAALRARRPQPEWLHRLIAPSRHRAGPRSRQLAASTWSSPRRAVGSIPAKAASVPGRDSCDPGSYDCPMSRAVDVGCWPLAFTSARAVRDRRRDRRRVSISADLRDAQLGDSNRRPVLERLRARRLAGSEVVRGPRFARNLVQHKWAGAVEWQATAPGWYWRPAADLGSRRKPGREHYERDLAGKPWRRRSSSSIRPSRRSRCSSTPRDQSQECGEPASALLGLRHRTSQADVRKALRQRYDAALWPVGATTWGTRWNVARTNATLPHSEQQDRAARVHDAVRSLSSSTPTR
jgi:hypothetical protein